MRIVTTSKRRQRKTIRADVPISMAVAAPVRTGHHAVLDWLVSRWPRRVLHFNQCFHMKRECRRIFIYNPGKSIDVVRTFQPVREPDNTRYVTNFEGTLRHQFLQAVETWRPRSIVLVLRDPFNTAASWLRKLWTLHKWPWPADPWIWIARVFAGEDDDVPHSRCVDFNEWVRTTDWRRVHPAGKGSSFTQTRKLRRKNVLRRWQCYCDDPEFERQVLGNAEVMRLARILYPQLTEEVEKAWAT